MKQIHPLQNMTIQSVYLARSVLVNFININVDNQIKLIFFYSGYEGESSLSRTVSVVNDDDFDSAPELAELELIHKILKKTKRSRTHPRRSATISHISEVKILFCMTLFDLGFLFLFLFRVILRLDQFISVYKSLLTL